MRIFSGWNDGHEPNGFRGDAAQCPFSCDASRKYDTEPGEAGGFADKWAEINGLAPGLLFWGKAMGTDHAVSRPFPSRHAVTA